MNKIATDKIADSMPTTAETATGKPATAKLFKNGRSQAVRLPKEFQFAGTEVKISRVGQKVILEPVAFDVDAWFARLDALRERAGPFMPEGRNQPPMPPPENIFDDQE